MILYKIKKELKITITNNEQNIQQQQFAHLNYETMNI